MRRSHLIVGYAGVIVFILSGQYMDRWLGHLAGMADLPRMLYRSGHIYLLMASLLNLALGLYLSEADGGWRRIVQRVGSVLVVVAPILFLVGFTQESARTDFERPWAGPAIHGLFGGVLLMAIAGSGRRRST